MSDCNHVGSKWDEEAGLWRCLMCPATSKRAFELSASTAKTKEPRVEFAPRLVLLPARPCAVCGGSYNDHEESRIACSRYCCGESCRGMCGCGCQTCNSPCTFCGLAPHDRHFLFSIISRYVHQHDSDRGDTEGGPDKRCDCKICLDARGPADEHYRESSTSASAVITAEQRASWRAHIAEARSYTGPHRHLYRFSPDAIERLLDALDSVEHENRHAVSENLAFNIRMSRELNELRTRAEAAERDNERLRDRSGVATDEDTHW